MCASMNAGSTTQVTADILCEFLEVAFHCILYTRGLYPAGVFERRKKYNVPVQMCLHPDVVQYIVNTLESLKTLLEGQDMKRLDFVVLSSSGKPLERFVFEIVFSSGSKEDNLFFELERSLRAFLLKLNVCDASLHPIPDDATWAVHIHTKDLAALQLEEKQLLKNFPWVEVDDDKKSIMNPTTLPLKAMKSDIIQMQLFVEESADKTTVNP